MNETKSCQNCKQNFPIDSEDFNFYKKMDVPPPTFCPRCRLERRIIWRNEHNLYRRPDSLTGKEIFAEFSKDVPLTIYDVEYWKSDAWDALEFGAEYDFSRPFFDQLKDLLKRIPWPSRSVVNLVNSDYCAQAGNLKNCYLVFNADYTENSAYCVRIAHLKECFDILDGQRGELCYNSTFILDAFKVFFSFNCLESNDIWCSKDLVGCNSCVGCVGLRKKSYCIFNEQYSKEDYFQKIKELKLNTHSGLQAVMAKAKELVAAKPVRYLRGINNVGSTGDNLTHTKNCKECWGVHDGQDMKYCQMAYRGVTDSYDFSVWGDGATRIYECMTCGYEVDSIKFCWDCWPACQRLEYSLCCRSSSDSFGCFGIKKKQYCILNKQYTKEEYEALIPKIKKQMDEMPYVDGRGHTYKYGEFFPPEFSPYGYNESQLQSVFPETKEGAQAKGFTWSEIERKNFPITMQTGDIPDDIDLVTDDILKQIIGCEDCGRAFRIIPVELQFLKSQRIPLPRACHECRLIKRHALIAPPVFYDRTCAKCSADIRTTYSPTGPEIVYCEACYQKEVE